MIFDITEAEAKHLITSLTQSINTMKDDHKKVSLISSMGIQTGIIEFEKLKTLLISYWDYAQDGSPPLADNKLIIAAPELLKALKIARIALIEAEPNYGHRPAIDLAFEAIKKAEGN